MGTPSLDSRFHGMHNAKLCTDCAPCAVESNSLKIKGGNLHNPPPPGSLPPGEGDAVYPRDGDPSIGPVHHLHAPSGDGGANRAPTAQGVHCASTVQIVHSEQVSSDVLAFAVRLRDRFGDGVKLYPWPGYLDRLDRLGLDTKALRAERWGM